MAEVAIREKVWEEFTALARRLRRKPEALAESVLRDYIQRIEDKELIAATERAFRRSGIREEDVEELIREYRRKKRAGMANGSKKETNTGGS